MRGGSSYYQGNMTYFPFLLFGTLLFHTFFKYNNLNEIFMILYRIPLHWTHKNIEPGYLFLCNREKKSLNNWHQISEKGTVGLNKR